jgi:uracil-DNA glycosylase
MKSGIEESWEKVLAHVLESSTMTQIESELQKESKNNVLLFPPEECIFAAFDHTPFEKVKVVILGQDPYHGPGQAHGLSFSVPEGVQQPPSLKNIFKELHDDIGVSIPLSGNLTGWADQGVLLLNAILTVRAHQAASHRKIGWESFTDGVIQAISDTTEGVVFILWGNFARSKKHLIDETKHKIIESAHPSPLSAYNGFLGSKPFSQTNEYLQSIGKESIDWGNL